MNDFQTREAALSGRDVVFTLDPGFRKPLVGRGIAALIATVPMLLLGLLTAAAGFFSTFIWFWVAVTGAAALDYWVRYFWVGRFRTRLSPEGIGIRGYFNHFVPWVEVIGMEVTGYDEPTNLGRDTADRYFNATGGVRAKLYTVRLVRAGHRRRMLLRAPLVTAWQSDPEFTDKVDTIRDWYRTYGHGDRPVRRAR
jgi:hypothetical protein